MHPQILLVPFAKLISVGTELTAQGPLRTFCVGLWQSLQRQMEVSSSMAPPQGRATLQGLGREQGKPSWPHPARLSLSGEGGSAQSRDIQVHLPQRLQSGARAGVAAELRGGVQVPPSSDSFCTTPQRRLSRTVCPPAARAAGCTYTCGASSWGDRVGDPGGG